MLKSDYTHTRAMLKTVTFQQKEQLTQTRAERGGNYMPMGPVRYPSQQASEPQTTTHPQQEPSGTMPEGPTRYLH